MDILMVAAELSPYARVTRAADVVAGLGKAACQLGHEVTVALPRYRSFEGGGLLVARRLTPLSLSDDEQVTVFDGQLASGVKIILFDAPEFFDRPGQFGEDGEDYADNAERFALLCRAAAALAAGRAEQGRPFDVVHLHDWPVAPTALLLRTPPQVVGAAVLTIHDAKSQGAYSKKAVDAFRVPRSLHKLLELEGSMNFLCAGVRTADAITTVSPTYARELASGADASAIGPILSKREEEIVGIVSGLDFAVFNPATDSAIASRYDAEDTANKGSSKTDLLRAHGLLADPAAPLLVAIADTGSEAEIVKELVADILKADAGLIVYGRDSDGLLEAIDGERRRFSSRCAHAGAIDDVQLRRASAAADCLLLPQTHDLDGLYVRAAHRYGAIPIVADVGALRDLVVDCDAHLETGTGFVAENTGVAAFRAALGRALSAYRSDRWSALRRRVMRLDLAWDRPARRYVQVYRQAQQSRRARSTEIRPA